jgi:hypothetical protein
MTYDLRRLRLAGLIRRIEHTNRYPDARRQQDRDLLHQGAQPAPAPLLAADQPQAPAEFSRALRVLDQHVDAYITHARLGRAA